MNAIYYSFVTATSTGYGDITSIGFLKIFSVLEII
ncbi:MAG: ion channel [archaeon]